MDILKRAASQLLSQRSLRAFVDLTTPDFKSHKWQHNLANLLEELQDPKTKQSTGKRIRIHAPSQVGKSQIVSKRLPLWLLVNNPLARIVIITYSMTFAKQFCNAIKASIPFVQEIFPNFELDGTLQSGLVTKERAALGDATPSIFFASVETGFTGRGFDYVIIDDPYKSLADVQSASYAESVRSLFEDVVMPRATKDTSFIMMYHAWAVGDMGDMLVEKYNFQPIRFPSVCDGGLDDPTYIDNGGWRNIGELLSPRLDKTVLEEMEEKSPASFQALHMGKPIARQQLVFGGLDIPIVPHAELGTIWVRAWDLATSTKTTADCTASVKVGIAPSGTIYLEAPVNERLTISQVEQKLLQIASNEPDIPVIIENKSVGLSLYQLLVANKRAGKINVKPPINITGDKITRASALASRSNLIKLVDSPNIHILKAQIQNWTGKSTEKDDLIDATTLGYNWLVDKRIDATTAQKKADNIGLDLLNQLQR